MGDRESGVQPPGRDALAERRRVRPGRKLDVSRNAEILDAALAVLAETGYDAMTVDMVASRAKAARATVYRRWATKADLAVDAVRHMSQTDVDPGRLPDTGSLREDLVATIVPHSIDEQQLRIKVLRGLVTLTTSDPRLADVGVGAGIGPWVEAGRTLLQRAIDRGDYPQVDVDTIAHVIPMMCICRAAVQQQPITREFSLALIDSIIIPAMRGAETRSSP